eukprot:TRINITY_DN16824_c0_g1_i1.p2 TRINITY_DN16824_c0_g1~~TRINITY_DN16824_c0_g1_i1.p2  ORF type:complete len:118 (-),score=36.83 TRINITY_DN16824_c0_g1_i1:136-489(-)
MLSCHIQPSTKLNYVTSTLIILIMGLALAQGERIKREAGFYTTRFGRSDPMMRLHEVQTRFVPEQGQHLSDVGIDQSINSENEVRCIFSVRRRVFVCHPEVEERRRRSADDLVRPLS